MGNQFTYIHFVFDEEMFWIEIDRDSYATRQIIINSKDNVQLSCFEDCLSEGKLSKEDFDSSVEYISESEFSSLWLNLTLPNMEYWEKNKSSYEVGLILEGKVLYHYPSGWIIEVDKQLGLLVEDKALRVNESISVKVRGYDDTNMWLLLETR